MWMVASLAKKKSPQTRSTGDMAKAVARAARDAGVRRMQTACYQVTTLATPPQNVAHAVARVLALVRVVVAPPAARVSVAEPVVPTALWQGKAHARMEPLVVVGVPRGKAIE